MSALKLSRAARLVVVACLAVAGMAVAGGTTPAGAQPVALQVPVKSASRTVWLSTANPSKSGGTIFYARVMPVVSGGAVPTGTVTFSDGDGRTNEATLNAYGQAVWYDTALGAGEYSVGATYNGSDTYAGSAAPSRTQTVDKAETTTKIQTTTKKNGDTIVYATVRAVAPGRGIPTGEVTFTDANGNETTATLSQYGIAYTVLTPSQAPLALADYHGDGGYNASTYRSPSTVDQSNLGAAVNGYHRAAWDPYATITVTQTFRAGRTGSMDKISVEAWWAAGTSPTDTQVWIQAVDGGGYPTGPVLATGVLETELFQGPGVQMVDIVLSTPVDVLEDTGYAMTFLTGSGGGTFSLSSTADVYGRGQAYESFSLLGRSPDKTFFGDLKFATWVWSPPGTSAGAA